MNNTNNELSHAVNIYKKNHEKLKIYEKAKNTEFKVEPEESGSEELIKKYFDKDTKTKMILVVLI